MRLWGKKPKPPDYTEWESYIKAKIDRISGELAKTFAKDLEKATVLVARVADLERKAVNTNEGLIRFGHRVDKIETMRTPNQQLADGLQQIIKKLATMDEDKQRYADQIRLLHEFILNMPDWILTKESEKS